MGIQDIDLDSPNITYLESMMIQAMLEKREKYIAEGRKKEAHGAGTIIWLYWRWLHGFPHTEPSVPAELE